MAALLLLSSSAVVRAHHSIAAEFDTSKSVTLHGKVTRVDWVNPHVHFWMDSADAKGVVANWTVECTAPNYLQRLGWTKNTVKIGDVLTVLAYPSKDLAHFAKTDTITLPDGRRITTGHVDDGALNKR